MKKLIKYIESLENGSFDGCNRDERLAAYTSIKNKALELSKMKNSKLKLEIAKYEEVFKVLCGKSPRKVAIKNYLTKEDSHIELQEFCVNNTLIPWALGINVLDAVDLLVNNKE